MEMLKSRGHRITKQGIPLRSIYYTLQLEEKLPGCGKHSASTVFFHSYSVLRSSSPLLDVPLPGPPSVMSAQLLTAGVSSHTCG